ncbi:Ubiquitin carboxyl-terminal hydrolase 12 [Sesamum alatum]|uniref:ubiquitinyl hydrolase 1 n=1 Tax=Sesamum alatum TaxID=300844 RepID=A0AAE2CZM1_9LAMI|nr:Ubiquitin carboxyl-terminal hydrolase 12 [Sesamum alatum]
MPLMPSWDHDEEEDVNIFIPEAMELEAPISIEEAKHQLNAGESSWGFTSFMPLNDLYDTSRGFIIDDTCVIKVEVVIYRAMDQWFYDSKDETGYVGLKNQGATCYMNSLLQMLFHIPYFRKVVYHMPTSADDEPSTSTPMALQSLFYKLEHNENSVGTKDLTRSFGWETCDAFLQHDVQELNRVLCENLEEKMKGTVVEGAIQDLFEGHHKSYIECINVDYKSGRQESLYDLQLDVKGCHDVYASFDKYVEVEHLDGDNKYNAGQHGLQDAKKGVLFIDFPPVLQLHLKRFAYDIVQDGMVKINDRYEFPLQLDLDRDNGRYLSPEADRRVRNLYTTHSVLVHSGGVHGGHYYAFIRPTLSSQWYKFDDERVTKEDMTKALNELYGGEEETNPGINNAPFKFTRHSNAYMLVYIRESDKDKILCDIDESDISEHLRERLKREQKEKELKKKEKAEAHKYMIVKVVTDEDFAQQIGRDICFDLVDDAKVKSFRVQKLKSFHTFKEEIASEFRAPVYFQRFWLWGKRQNQTHRPIRPMTLLEESYSVGLLKELSIKDQNDELKLFLEVQRQKLYEPEKGELRYAGRLFVKSYGKPADILEKLNELAGYAPDEEIELFEEIKFEPTVSCEYIDKRLTFSSNQLEDGDIICYQKSLPAQTRRQLRCPDVPSFLEYQHTLQVIHFRSLERPGEDEFCLQLSNLDSYDEVVERVANQLRVDDPAKVRLTSHNIYSQQPKAHPVRYRGVENLLEMLLHYDQPSEILYFEVLDIPLPELQELRILKLAFSHAEKTELETRSIRLPKESTVGDVLEDLRKKVELSRPSAELRLLGIFSHKIYKIHASSDKIATINDHRWTLRAEEIPEEEKLLGLSNCLIHVYHFMYEDAQNRTRIQNFGEPFLLMISDGETLCHIKARVQNKLQVRDEEFSKWKFAFVSCGRAEYLEDSDTLFNRFQRSGIRFPWEQYLGLEHINKTPRRPAAAYQYRTLHDKPVRIYN